MDARAEAEGALQYQRERPADIRRAHRRHPFGYHIEQLQTMLETLAHELGLPPAPSILDYGCADLPYRHLFPADARYVGADLPGNPIADMLIDGSGRLPAPDGAFDAVVSTQVLEHVCDPALYLAECHRVLRPGGKLLLSTHGIFFYHPDPADLWRWTCEGLRRAVEEPGFQVARFEGVIGLAATGLQLVQDSLSWRIPRRLVPWLALVMQTMIRIVDRFDTPEARRLNAQVFTLIAVKS